MSYPLVAHCERLESIRAADRVVTLLATYWPTLKANQTRQAANVRDLPIAVELVGRHFVAASDKCLVLDFHVVGREQVVTEAGRHMKDVVRAATQVIEHEFKRRQARLVGLSLFSGEDLVKRRT